MAAATAGTFRPFSLGGRVFTAFTLAASHRPPAARPPLVARPLTRHAPGLPASSSQRGLSTPARSTFPRHSRSRSHATTRRLRSTIQRASARQAVFRRRLGLAPHRTWLPASAGPCCFETVLESDVRVLCRPRLRLAHCRSIVSGIVLEPTMGTANQDIRIPELTPRSGRIWFLLCPQTKVTSRPGLRSRHSDGRSRAGLGKEESACVLASPGKYSCVVRPDDSRLLLDGTAASGRIQPSRSRPEKLSRIVYCARAAGTPPGVLPRCDRLQKSSSAPQSAESPRYDAFR